MSTVIFGKGVVGLATGKVLKGSDFHDPAMGSNVVDFKKYHYAVICVPTPGNSAGLDHKEVTASLNVLKEKGFSGVVVIRSTCTPDYLANIDYHSVVYWPEFLRERSAEVDALNPHVVVLGGTNYMTEKFTELLEKAGHSCPRWYRTDLTTAAVIKLGLNAALAAKVALFNSLYEIAEEQGADFKTVRTAIGADWRIGFGQTDVPGPDGSLGFGGKCLPKDVNALNTLAKDNVYLGSILKYNKTLRKDLS